MAKGDEPARMFVVLPRSIDGAKVWPVEFFTKQRGVQEALFFANHPYHEATWTAVLLETEHVIHSLYA